MKVMGVYNGGRSKGKDRRLADLLEGWGYIHERRGENFPGRGSPEKKGNWRLTENEVWNGRWRLRSHRGQG